MDYIASCCRDSGCDEDTVGQITIACSEILANIDSYAYENGGDVEIQTKCRDRVMTIVFRDNGQPFDPLKKQDPDVTLPLNERRRGGLGILPQDIPVEVIAEVVRRVAAKHGLPLIDLQPIFDAACEQAPAAHWSTDGVHPTPAGHELIKRAWLQAFESMKEC